MDGHQNFVDLKIKTRDELEDLSNSMKKMENDINIRINQLLDMNKKLVASQKQTKKMKELANRDGLTGVQNKIAYNTEEIKINENILKGISEPFGIAMIDLNYLKVTNDEYGHDAGDIALIKLANIICEVFDHSPVYRIGGDEFVVILRKRDYEDDERLIATFNRNIELHNKDNNVPENERISAAIGYSKFDKETDSCVDDVFKRADKEMYERKHQMKQK